jgi:hypothetical protein
MLGEINENRYLVEYIRTKNNTPVGCLVGMKYTLSKGKNLILITMSRYNTKKEKVPFTKKMARNISLNRNIKMYLYIDDLIKNKIDISYESLDETCFDGLNKKVALSKFRPQLEHFKKRCEKYFKSNKIMLIL